jgi:hypothetical protein
MRKFGRKIFWKSKKYTKKEKKMQKILWKKNNLKFRQFLFFSTQKYPAHFSHEALCLKFWWNLFRNQFLLVSAKLKQDD